MFRLVNNTCCRRCFRTFGPIASLCRAISSTTVWCMALFSWPLIKPMMLSLISCNFVISRWSSSNGAWWRGSCVKKAKLCMNRKGNRFFNFTMLPMFDVLDIDIWPGLVRSIWVRWLVWCRMSARKIFWVDNN